MDPSNIKDLLQSLKMEALRYRYVIAALFIAVSSVVLVAGFMMPKTYSSKVILYADVSNIIGNLLEGQAEITRIDRAKEARDIVFTDRILRSVAIESGFEQPDDSIPRLRNGLRISANGDYVEISYRTSNADTAFKVVSAVTQEFIEETSRKKREESRGAFEFIDSQVASYQRQLEAAENRLKEFNSQNIDITEQSVTNRVNGIKNEIQTLRLSVQDSEARLRSFEAQMLTEPEFLTVERDIEPTSRERRMEAYEEQLAELRLSYRDTHPDIVNLMEQMAVLETQIEQERVNNPGRSAVERVENPAMTNLKEMISNERATLSAARQRLSNLNELLEGEYANAETVAAKQARLQELTRDYSVTKDVYEDMLQTRENARLSMTLDIEGQGVTYKIHEPPSYPVRWDGLQLVHFAALGPLLGLMLPLGLTGALVLFDPRVRSASYMESQLPAHVQLVTSIPLYNSAVSEVASKRSLIFLALLVLLYLAVYGFVVFGASPELISTILPTL